MLKNLEDARKSKRISLEQLAAVIGVSRYQTISDKINGISKFTFDEALLIQKSFFPEYDFIHLFSREKEHQST